MNEKYILIKLSDAKLIKKILDEEVLSYTGPYAYVFSDIRYRINKELSPLLARIEQETGGDFVDISTQLKTLPMCSACIIEGQEHTCQSISAQRLGRRLLRLIKRAGN